MEAENNQKIADIVPGQLTVGRALLTIEGATFANPRVVDAAKAIFPVGEISRKGKEVTIEAAVVGVIRSRRGLISHLEATRNLPATVERPPRIRELLDWVGTIPQYNGYSIDDLILVLQRKKDFEGRQKPIEDIAEGQARIGYLLFALKPDKTDWEHPTLRSAANIIHPFYTGEDSVERRRSIRNSNIEAIVARKSLIRHLEDAKGVGKESIPKRMTEFLKFVETQIGGVDIEDIVALAMRKKTLSQFRQESMKLEKQG